MSDHGKRPRRSGINRQGAAGWIFVAPTILILGLFMFVPVLMAAWVSLSNWNGHGSPLEAGVGYVGGNNYVAVLNGQGIAGRDFGTSIRNNFYYALLVVPIQTAVSLALATFVNRRALKGRAFFRTAFYFPSVTSSVAITVLWLFLFAGTGSVNSVLSWFGIHGPNWFQDSRGIFQILLNALGVQTPANPPASLFGISWWEWVAGPSVAMCAFIFMAVFTTSGTFMLLFLAALQAIGEETDEAAMIDGASAWQRFRYVTVPMLRPTLFTVLTLGTIGTWQVFDQIYTGTKGGPSKTTLTPAYLSYDAAFTSQAWGRGSAIAFILFFIIIVFTLLQRMILGQADPTLPSRRDRLAQRRLSIAARRATTKGA